MTKKMRQPAVGRKLCKSLTGIPGFDDITDGGLPTGRPTLVCGGAGSGKSLFAAEFLIHGAILFKEPGVLMTFEESADDITKNVASLGFDLPALIRQKKIVVDYVHVDRNEIEENGEYDLEGLFIRLAYAIDQIGAKRVVLDTIESLFAGLSNQAILRAELRRLFTWLKDRGMTTIITGEKGEGTLTRQGLEEYVSDCVILLDHRVNGQISTRRLRVVKYRGTVHGTNEYPFLIDQDGITVLPITASTMDYAVSNQRESTGIPELDQMLGGKGLYRGSTVMISGSAGTGKTSISACLADATCRRNQRCIFFSFEESPAQIIRNMRSLNLDLEPHVRKGLLKFHSTRPTMFGLEMHLVLMHKMIEEFNPAMVIIDPISNLSTAGTVLDSANMLIRLIDFLRQKRITTILVSLTQGGKALEATDEKISSIVDTWVLVRDIELGGERNRGLYVLKSRGMAHSNQIREFLITHKGIKLVPVYLGQEGVLTGSARLAQENREKQQEKLLRYELQQKSLALEHRRKLVAARIASIQAEFQREEEEFRRTADITQMQERQIAADRQNMTRSRQR